MTKIKAVNERGDHSVTAGTVDATRPVATVHSIFTLKRMYVVEVCSLNARGQCRAGLVI